MVEKFKLQSSCAARVDMKLVRIFGRTVVYAVLCAEGCAVLLVSMMTELGRMTPVLCAKPG